MTCNTPWNTTIYQHTPISYHMYIYIYRPSLWVWHPVTDRSYLSFLMPHTAHRHSFCVLRMTSFSSSWTFMSNCMIAKWKSSLFFLTGMGSRDVSISRHLFSDRLVNNLLRHMVSLGHSSLRCAVSYAANIFEIFCWTDGRVTGDLMHHDTLATSVFTALDTYIRLSRIHRLYPDEKCV